MIEYTPPPGLHKSEFPDGGFWYWKDGKPIRSVSKILNVIYHLPPGLPQWALERGKMIHAATVMIDSGTLDWQNLDDRLKPFCTAYVDFLATAKPVVEASELTVVHPSYKFGARLDRVYRLPGQARLIVCDIKGGTGKEDRYWLQVAACAMALDDANVHDYDLALLNLDKDGRPHFTTAPHPGSWVNRWREILEKDVA
jgi:hypothetical protein